MPERVAFLCSFSFHLVSAHKVHHKVIDFNRDARQAGTGDAENKAVHDYVGFTAHRGP